MTDTGPDGGIDRGLLALGLIGLGRRQEEHPVAALQGGFERVGLVKVTVDCFGPEPLDLGSAGPAMGQSAHGNIKLGESLQEGRAHPAGAPDAEYHVALPRRMQRNHPRTPCSRTASSTVPAPSSTGSR